MKLVIVGGGVMGSAFARSFLHRDILKPSNLTIIEADTSKHAELHSAFQCDVHTDISSLGDADVVLLCMKPQDLASCGAAARTVLSPRTILISILAGIPIASVRSAFNAPGRCIRAMPNTPAQIGQGMTAYCSDQELTEAEKMIVDQLFRACGESLYLPDESLMNAVTAVSGSGPAYVFLFIESMMKAAQQMGFSAADARLLIGQTVRGACALWDAGDESAATLRERVTSRGGTTAAALAVFEQHQFSETVISAMLRAEQRARELAS